MRRRSSIPALMSILLLTVACESTSPSDSGGFVAVAVAPSVVTLSGGASLRLILTARDQSGQPVSASSAIWTASNPEVATFRADGTVTGHTTGSSRISAWWNGLEGVSVVSVVPDTSSTPGCTAKSKLKACHPQ